ncbi:MAG: glycogen synthase [Parachlamydiales bacterium]|nr:glycogen synthase [Verrucomicrobiota bacterium]MBX3718838.1 glycogen synthase [Candidatus Acheromyda pituitae]
MHIIHVATELAPIAKAGGLGDVIYGLSKELCKLGHQVEIVLPKFDCIDFSQVKNLKVEMRDLWSFDGPYRFNNTIWSAQVDGLKVNLIEPHHPDYFFSRGMIYGCPDDINRFCYFSRAAMEYLFKSGKQPDALHAHDWPTALIPVLYKEMYMALGYRTGGTVLTIHNLEHQGRCPPSQLSRVGLRGESYLTSEKMKDLHHPTLVNLLKGGIVYSDRITTVSPNYEKEILTQEGGFALEDTLKDHKRKLSGILNGIDEVFWNPQSDHYLVKKYETHNVNTAEKLAQVLAGKKENRRHLRTHLQLEDSDCPIVASVTRLVPQKGPELIKGALKRTLEKGGQFILLGSSPIPEIHKEFELLQEKFKNDKRVAILMDKDEALAHLIFAAADMFIIPSLFEPCGLTQMIALRYGTVPIVRMTGGLADTVFDIETSLKPADERNGFTFDYPDEQGVCWALDRALDCFKEDPKRWHQLMRNGMKEDFTWKRAGRKYVEIYEQLKPPAVEEKIPVKETILKKSLKLS